MCNIYVLEPFVLPYVYDLNFVSAMSLQIYICCALRKIKYFGIVIILILILILINNNNNNNEL